MRGGRDLTGQGRLFARGCAVAQQQRCLIGRRGHDDDCGEGSPQCGRHPVLPDLDLGEPVAKHILRNWAGHQCPLAANDLKGREVEHFPPVGGAHPALDEPLTGDLGERDRACDPPNPPVEPGNGISQPHRPRPRLCFQRLCVL
jgi:hypothetical protein